MFNIDLINKLEPHSRASRQHRNWPSLRFDQFVRLKSNHSILDLRAPHADHTPIGTLTLICRVTRRQTKAKAMMMKARSAELTIDIPISLRQSLEDEARRASTTPSAVVCTALALRLGHAGDEARPTIRRI
ncbi:hypothetical protein QA641_31505 [Bradyrhizobium sp. CB1650]|uniref:hypothetical protein n=1 Tax=Bradyrhizobium sp. CB1650 TaxID=3039153 RepID=UPI002434A9D4|nr:hypothetical protein [Bradyrhizobium sp. CB1650]WGD50118.1 hypothetical protein QA641_31505 [Bradyrhizobium sp. CB1650]